MSSADSPTRLLTCTAYWTAAVRAQESGRQDRLFHDPWAATLADKEGSAWIEQRSAASVIPIVLRTRFFDDFLTRTVAETGIRQIVLLGAGLDTRAYRLDWPEGTCFYELDQAPILQFKRHALASAQPKCERRTISVDLLSPWEQALAEAGFAASRPAVWLLEGFLFYLSDTHLTALLERVLQLMAPASQIGFDVINKLTLTSPLTSRWVEMQASCGAPWIGSMDDPVGFLAAHDCRAILTSPGAPAANYDRWPYPVIPVTMPEMPHLWFVTAEKQIVANSRKKERVE
ncbi:SAM-dependent methyltransferase [candidate division KSB1 bacterium]|nr:SAM-dependent methyltransferase [candidate division KSB1 bacterium]